MGIPAGFWLHLEAFAPEFGDSHATDDATPAPSVAASSSSSMPMLAVPTIKHERGEKRQPLAEHPELRKRHKSSEA